MNLMRSGDIGTVQSILPPSLSHSFFLSLPLVSGAFKCICDLVMGDSGSLLNPFSIARSLHLSPWPAGFLLDEGWDLCSPDRRKDKLWVFPLEQSVNDAIVLLRDRCHCQDKEKQRETRNLSETPTH